VCGTVNAPEFLGKPAKLNSNYVSTEMLLAHERYAARLIFLGGQIYKNEVLARLHSCG
jgi:hypothetical protein